ncbi:hypothetical protein [Streptomyces sp. NPDC041003]|uniref:hypothetical protein n=1 Tax=Streptomyces sp. NPDC041003 TaxID=3155730 RepID=UPI0033C33899
MDVEELPPRLADAVQGVDDGDDPRVRPPQPGEELGVDGRVVLGSPVHTAEVAGLDPRRRAQQEGALAGQAGMFGGEPPAEGMSGPPRLASGAGGFDGVDHAGRDT